MLFLDFTDILDGEGSNFKGFECCYSIKLRETELKGAVGFKLDFRIFGVQESRDGGD